MINITIIMINMIIIIMQVAGVGECQVTNGGAGEQECVS